MTLSMTRTLNLLHFHLRRFGWPGGLGMALIVLALGLDIVQLTPLEAALEAAGQRSSAVRQPPMNRPAQALPGSTDPALHTLFAIAEHTGISLTQGHYREESLAATTRRLYIDLPVTATYPATRAFLAEALARIPGLSLTHLQLSRERIEQARLEVHIRFILVSGARHAR